MNLSVDSILEIRELIYVGRTVWIDAAGEYGLKFEHGVAPVSAGWTRVNESRSVGDVVDDSELHLLDDLPMHVRGVCELALYRGYVIYARHGGVLLINDGGWKLWWRRKLEGLVCGTRRIRS